MNPERWQQIDQLFHAVLAREPAERAAFIAKSCADDESLRTEIEDLLASHEQAESFIEAPASDIAAALLAKRETGLRAGEMVGPYRIECVLGVGGMGEVYRALDTRLGRRVALKLLPPQFTIDSDRLRRFEQEARAASALNHPNIVTIHEIGRTNGSQFIVTEFIEGRTLRQRLIETGLSVDESLDIGIQVAGALAAAHAAGIVHRDIKPENIMLRADGYVKVLDFGLAKLTERPAADSETEARTLVKTNPGMVMGTVEYMSPEQARAKDVDARTDIWSLGVVLYEMVAGRVPFAGETPSHVMVSLMEKDPPPMADVADVPIELERIITKALRKRKEERYQTAKELALDLKNLRQVLEVGRLRRSLESGAKGKEATAKAQVDAGGGLETRTAHTPTARPTSSAEYLVSEIRRHKRGVKFAAVGAVVAIIAIVAMSYFNRKNAPAATAEPVDSVAVLPFVNATNDPNTEYLAEGISDSVINSLSRLRELRVNSLNSVMRYKGKQVDAQAIGRELNVRAVLMGRMTQRGDDLTVSAELVDARDHRRLWGGQYSRKISDILIVENEIAQEIAQKLRPGLTGQEQQQLARHNTENTEAYHLFSLGSYYFRKGVAGGKGTEGALKSIDYFNRAIEADPNYALAYFGLFRSYFSLGADGQVPSKEIRPKIEWAALKAVELDDSMAAAHGALGFAKKMNWDWQGAEKEYRRAIELDPNNFDGYFGYYILLINIGRPDEAIPLAKRTDELDDLRPPRSNSAFAYLYKREFDTVIDWLRKAKERNPKRGILNLGEAYLGKGMNDEAVAEFENLVNPEDAASWRGYPFLAYAYAAAGQRDKALKILTDQKKLAKERYVSPFNFAIIYTGLGDKDRAFEYLEKSIEERVIVLYHFPHRPIFDPLRSDLRYEKLLRKMNFPV